MGFVGNYAPCRLSPQTDGMPVILENPQRCDLWGFSHVFAEHLFRLPIGIIAYASLFGKIQLSLIY